MEYPRTILVTKRTAILSIERNTSSAIASAAANVLELVAALLDVWVARWVVGAGEDGVDAQAEEQDLEHEDWDCGVVGETLEGLVSGMNWKAWMRGLERKGGCGRRTVLAQRPSNCFGGP